MDPITNLRNYDASLAGVRGSFSHGSSGVLEGQIRLDAPITPRNLLCDRLCSALDTSTHRSIVLGQQQLTIAPCASSDPWRYSYCL